jgi:hypothetical protein
MKRVTMGCLWLCSLIVAPLAAQTTIGGGTCNTATLTGVYAVSFEGHQDTSGSYTNLMQANGSASFDGKGNVTLALTQNNLQTTGAALLWGGTYSVGTTCGATVTITSGGTATLNLALYSGGSDFLIVGSDATFVYIGTGTIQPATTCSPASLNGVYVFSARGYGISGGAVSSAFVISGLAQFDGQGHVTITSTYAPVTSTGTYMLSTSCLGTGTVSVGSTNLTMTLSVYTAGPTAATDLFMNVAVGGSIANGAAHAAYGQPSSSAEARS